MKCIKTLCANGQEKEENVFSIRSNSHIYTEIRGRIVKQNPTTEIKSRRIWAKAQAHRKKHFSKSKPTITPVFLIQARGHENREEVELLFAKHLINIFF